jgi:flagellar basal-body rod modification protein FlgD
MAIDSLNTNPTSSAASAAALLNGTGGADKLASATEQSDRFLKLLVTQMQNQDPLNPMDNAQITTQMAQISTVSGIDKLNTSIADMGSAMLQSQSLQGAALVGKEVLLAGNDLVPDGNGLASGGFELTGPADRVVVTVTNGAGKVVDTIDLGAESAGRHTFDWVSKDAEAKGLTFSVSAKSGAAAVGTTPLVADRVKAVYSDAGQLNVELASHGIVKYSDIRAVS